MILWFRRDKASATSLVAPASSGDTSMSVENSDASTPSSSDDSKAVCSAGDSLRIFKKVFAYLLLIHIFTVFAKYIHARVTIFHEIRFRRN